MPCTYAHYKFGRELQKIYPEPLARIVRAHSCLFNIGVHGPDILFYYKALKNNAVNGTGFAMHREPGAVFLARAKEVYNLDKNEESLAYLLGFVSHFVLDSTCHGYIENKIRISHVTHAEIESEFDRYLLLKDGVEPLHARLTDHISPTLKNAEVIAPFYEGLTVSEIQKSMRSMIFYNNMLRAPRFCKRFLVNTAMRLSGNYAEMHGMMFAKKTISACEDSNLRLEKLFQRALTRCLFLTENFIGYLNDECPLHSDFSATFGPAEGWEKIPVLSKEEEINYEG